MAFIKHIERPALLPFSPVYGLAVLIRNLLFDIGIFKSVKFRTPVISIGNLTTGGTGKTPHVEYLAGLLHKEYEVAVLSRGYKRRTDQFIIVKRKSRVTEVGDEPLQIKQKFPDVHVAVHKSRVEGIRILEKNFKNLKLVLLDDAFQHRYVKPGLSILLVDYNRPVFDDITLPAGNLREPISGLNRADIILITKCPAGLSSLSRGDFIARLRPSALQHVFFTRYEYGPLTGVFKNKQDGNSTIPYKKLSRPGVSVMLVTGIANPSPLRKFIEEHAKIDDEIIFPDHHFFTEKDVQLIWSKYASLISAEKYIIVTEKDALRLREANIHNKEFRRSIYYIPVEVKFLAKGEKPFVKKIFKYLKKAK